MNLDDKKEMTKSQGTEIAFRSFARLPFQVKQAWEESVQITFPEGYKKVTNIVIAGMGGSRFPAYILTELFKTNIKIPIILNDNYTLPSFVNENSLVILSSYSGSTEEVLFVGRQAFEKKAKISGITSGGALADFLTRVAAPSYICNPINNPSNQPRIGLGYGIGGLMGLFYQLGILSIDKQMVDTAIKDMFLFTKKYSPEAKNNKAKILAKKIYGKYPYYIVSEFLSGCGNAIANQTNETAKSISSFRIIPELNHHLMEGLKNPKELAKIGLFVFFFSKHYSEPIKKRFRITKDIVEQNKIETVWYELSGKNKVEDVFELVAFGSYLTMYLSILYQENPAIVPYVDYFKNKLKEI